jgi:hypothetical protein
VGDSVYEPLASSASRMRDGFLGFPQFTNILQIAVFLDRSSSRIFRRFTRVAAQAPYRSAA